MWAPTRFLSFAVVAACAKPVPRAPVDLRGADAELERGCYDCLIAARDAYRAAGAGPREFEADLVLAVRDKELGLPPSDAIADARRVASAVPDAARYLALVHAVPDDAVARSSRGVDVDQLDGERTWLATSPLGATARDYLALALDCAYTPLATAPPIRAVMPVLAYRKEICGLGRLSALSAMRDREPRFVETSYVMALSELAAWSTNGPMHAKQHLDEARAKFPASATIALALALYDRYIGDYAAALAIYDKLGDSPDALFGRMLTYGAMARPHDAIAAASILIDLGEHLGDAYAERAARHRDLGQLADARSDIDAARVHSAPPSVFTLAGMIEHDQGDYEAALADLDFAADVDDRDCTARWYLGLVGLKRATPASATAAFEAATECYRSRAKATTDEIHRLSARSDLDAGYRANRVAALEASVTADENQAIAAEHIIARLTHVGGSSPHH